MDKTYIEALMQAPSQAEKDITFQEAGKRALPRLLQRKREMVAWLHLRYIQPMRRWCRANRYYQFGAEIGVLTRTRSTKRAKIYRRKALS